MECWVNPDNSITPVLQYSNSEAAIDIRLSYPLCFALCALLARRGAAANESPPDRVSIGARPSLASESTRSEAIRLALRERGYIEGQNIAIEYRYAEGKPDRYPELAAELVRLKVDIIVAAGGDEMVWAAKNATKTIPIVIVGVGVDPVEAGLVESLARPGGNVTGVTNLSTDLGGKRLELLKEAVPKLARGAWAGVDCSVLGGTRCRRFREGIRRTEQGAPGWTLRAREPANAC